MIQVRQLTWDLGNVAHIARHEVTPDEVEEACHGQPFIQKTYGGRFLLTGPTTTGRMLAVVLAPEREPDCFYVVTARPADRKERRIYDQHQKGGAKQ